MIQIVEPPDVAACASCYRPLSWLYSPKAERWVPVVHHPEDRLMLRVHTCRRAGEPDRTPWRHLVRQPEHVITTGLARARAAIAPRSREST